MKLPYSWLTELTGVGWAPEEMVRRLTASGTAGVLERPRPEHFRNVVVGRITGLAKHPSADKLLIAEVDDGGRTHSVICGAPNCAVGQRVVLALPGANLRGEFPVNVITMRGVRSEGMICAEDELGLSPDHMGIMVLDDDAPVGQPVADYLGLNDPIINFEITPNRPDCLSAVGIAREVAALDGRPFRFEAPNPPESGRQSAELISVRIDDAEACPRYAVRMIAGVTLGRSPWWLRKRLLACGIRPINNIVDIANYVMLETGHPLHAFDYDRFGSTEAVVRRAREKEQFITLDGQEHTLDASILLITNGREGVAAAGVMGGLNSEVTSDTRTILLESAYFDPSTIRRSARALGVSTESSYRFERGVDPNGTIRAVDRAARLLAELAGGEVLAGVVDCHPRPIHPIRIELRPARVRHLLGAEIPEAFMEAILPRLGIEVTPGSPLAVTIPTFRPDITREVDLIEEILRIYGLDNIPTGRQNAGRLYTPTHRSETIKSDLRNILTGLGFDETLGTGFAHSDRLAQIDDTMAPIRVINPISDELAVMRSRMLYSLLVSAGNNVRHRNVDLKIFEVGRIYRRCDSGSVEPDVLGLLVTGRAEGRYWKSKSSPCDLFDLKGALSALGDGLDLTEVLLATEPFPGYDGTESYRIVCGDVLVGHGGRIDGRICRMFDIKQDCFAAELDLAALIGAEQELRPFRPLPKYPASSRDIAVVVDRDVPAARLLQEIAAAGGELVESVAIFDLFTGDPVPAGKKSLAFAVSYRSAEKTLEDDEVDRVHSRIVEHMERTFNARLRE